jgi:CRP/FNR family transcriptional regulator, cyclic AMP receptor protein
MDLCQGIASANFGKDGEPTPVDAAINQATLAEMIGTTPGRG